ncbi:MAG: polysaccharide deacetylase [Saprospiraceae bacterium]|nr:MAG: polysaccharide deacetylase [Saprospiraceae bacterium]
MKRYLKYVKRKYANLSFSKELNIQLNEPIVSFTFDDVPGCAFTNGGNILAKSGYAGTFYIALSFLDSNDQAFRFSTSQLQQAIQEKHELGGHTHSHIDLSQTSFSKSVQDIKENQRKLNNLFPELRLENFSYPFGSQTKAIKQFAGQYFKSARGIEPGLNIGKTDLLNLKANRLYEKSVPLTEVYRQIEEAIQRKAWLIFYTHDVKENPSKYGCSPLYFKSIVEVCNDLGLKVLPVREVLTLIEKENNLAFNHA